MLHVWVFKKLFFPTLLFFFDLLHPFGAVLGTLTHKEASRFEKSAGDLLILFWVLVGSMEEMISGY